MQTSLAFSSLFANKNSRFVLDLSNATLIEVLEAYQAHKRRTSPKYNLECVLFNIRNISEIYNTTIMPYEVTDVFYNCLIEWLTNKKLKGSTIKNYCGVIKTALTWGTRHNVKVSETYDQYDVKENEPMTISLTPAEIAHIAYFDIDNLKCRKHHKKTLEHVRDGFVLQCNLYQRYSDIVRMNKDNFCNGIYTCMQQKTGNKAHVDIAKLSATPEIAFELLEKYNYEFPYKSNVSNYNHYLKELMQCLNRSFDDDVVFECRNNGEIVKTSKPKWSLVTSHTARRSAITIGVSKDLREHEVRRASGHKNSHDSFNKYIRLND